MASKTQIVEKNVPTNLDLNTFENPTGEVFSHWNTHWDNSGVSYQDGAEIVVDEPTTLYAQWGYRVTWDSQGGTVPEQRIVLSNQQLGQLPDSVRDGFILNGWWPHPTSEIGGRITQHVIPTNNVTYYAHWKGETYGLVGSLTIEKKYQTKPEYVRGGRFIGGGTLQF